MIRRLASTTLSVALVAALSLPAQAHASAWSVLASTRAAVEEPASVLGLESDDAAAGEALTKALRKAFAKRGYSGGQEMSLVELRLTMGCSGDDPKCLSEGGKAIEVRRLIYGHLKKTGGGGYQLHLLMLSVGDATVEKETNRPLSAADLSRDKIDATATGLVNSLLPQESDDEPLPATGPKVDQPPVDDTTGTRPQPRQRDRKYKWGLDKPVPRWKAIGLGVSASLFVVSLGTAIGLTVATRTTLRDKLVREANASLTDTLEDGVTPNPANDVDPTVVSDICGEATSTPETEDNPDTPGDDRTFVKNKKITKVCNVAKGVERGQFVAWAGTAVFGVSTIVFSVLMFVKKNDSPAAAAAVRHRLRLGAMPTRDGFRVGGGFRF